MHAQLLSFRRSRVDECRIAGQRIIDCFRGGQTRGVGVGSAADDCPAAGDDCVEVAARGEVWAYLYARELSALTDALEEPLSDRLALPLGAGDEVVVDLIE